MPLSAHAHHRRAAFAALQPVLGDEDSVQALAWLHERLRSDAVADVIAFVDAVSTRHRLDDATRRRLYASLHAALRGPGVDLPPDPLPAMQAARGRPAAGAQWPVSRWPAAKVRAATEVGTPHAAADGAPQAVFASLMTALLATLHAPALATVRAAGLTQFELAHVSALTRETACAAWHQAGAQAWRIPGSVEELGELVHRVYLAMCEALGPEQADAMLAAASRVAAQLPEARQCPPGRLL